ncbi:MAG: Gldg family protein [Limisphaerales bacterium]
MSTADTPPPTFSRARRWTILLNNVLAVGAALALLVMANYLAGGYFKRSYWSRDASFELSNRTRNVLNSLTNDVSITIFFQPNGENQEIYLLTSALLAEYQQANPRHIRVKTLDYTRSVGEAKELLSKNSLTGLSDKDFVFFESNGHTKTVLARELAEYDWSEFLTQRSKYIRRSGFKGEMIFTSDIYDVSNPQPLKTYFLTGHGENDPGDPKGQDSKLGSSGYSKLAKMLKNEIDSNWDRLSLEGTNGIPTDCQLLIVAGPKGKILPEEQAKIAAYLKQGGRLLALLGTECGLEPVLTNWGVNVGHARVIEQDKNYCVEGGQMFFTCTLFTNPIVNPLASQKMGILMIFPRPLSIDRQSKIPGSPEANLLAATSTQAMDENKHVGEFPLLASVEQGVIQGVTSSHGGGTRMVVAGDSDFLDDQMLNTWVGNSYFAMSALNWLLERPQVLLNALGPQPIREYKLYMTNGQQRTVQWLFLGALPGAVLALGGLVWMRRRH